MSLFRCTALLAAMLAVPALAAAQTAVDSTRPPVQVASAEYDSPNTALRPGDVLRLKIWLEPDLSGDYAIDESGQAILPRLGPTQVTGIPANQLRDQLIERYRTYLNNPSIEITPLRRVSIIGAVQKPGIYPLEPSIKLGDAANIAGGGTTDSKRNHVELVRGSNRYSYDLRADPDKANVSLASGDQVYIPQRSWLSRNATWFVSTLVAIGGTAALLIAQ